MKSAYDPRTPAGPRVSGAIACAAAIIACAAGCTSLSYDRIRLGAEPRAYDAILPRDTTREASVGRCHLSKRGELVEAVILLLDETRQVAGKLYVASDKRRWRPPNSARFLLRIELDPPRYGVEHTGPADTLRALAYDLVEVESDAMAAEACVWAVAGIQRLLERWPGADAPEFDSEQVKLIRERVPGGGAIEFVGGDSDSRRVRFEYRVPAAN